MKLFLALFFLFSSTNILFSQDISSMLKEAERLEAQPDEKSAFNKYKLVLKSDPNNLQALCKASELCSRIGHRQADLKVRDSYYAAATMYASQALKVNPNSDEANVVMGIAIGRTSLTKSGKEKIAAAKEIKQYAETALKFNPQNFKAWHILGKWNYEVSNLNFMERAATRVFYGGLPNASLKNSIMAYEKARSLNATFLLNYLELAKAYKRNDELKKGIAILRAIAPLPIRTEDDPRIKKEAAVLLKNWL
jgi:hypothetical protein